MFVIPRQNDDNALLVNGQGSKMFFTTEEKAFEVLDKLPCKNKFYVRKAITRDYRKAHKRRTVTVS